jgi:uroporphyrinogen-III decarboxylase
MEGRWNSTGAACEVSIYGFIKVRCAYTLCTYVVQGGKARILLTSMWRSHALSKSVHTIPAEVSVYSAKLCTLEGTIVICCSDGWKAAEQQSH